MDASVVELTVSATSETSTGRGFGGSVGNDQSGSSSAESQLGISEMTEAVSGLLLAEMGPGLEAEEARPPSPDTGAVHGFDEDQREYQFIF